MILGFRTTYPWGGPTHFPERILAGTKIHTIRVDGNNRWRAGRMIQFATGVRTAKYRCFHEAPCMGVQNIHIEPEQALVYVDGRALTWEEIAVLAHNDGFDKTTDFARWFSKGFTGKIIHFTPLRY